MKGMRKIKRGKGFGGAVRYVLGREEGKEPGRLIGGNMAGASPEALTREFGQVRKTRKDIEKPVWHQALRAPEGEHLTDEKWVELADNYMKKMGFKETHQRIYVKHDDEGGIHIVANRISAEGEIYLGKNENLKSTKHVMALEKEYGLTITKGPEYDPETGKVKMPAKANLKKGEIETALHTGEEPTRQRLQRLVDEAARDKPTAPEFAERLALAGVSVRANVASTGRMNGFSFDLNGASFKASQLGNDYKWAELQKRVSYEQDRDSQGLERFRTPARDRAEDRRAAAEHSGPSRPDPERAGTDQVAGRDPRSLDTPGRDDQGTGGPANGRGDLGGDRGEIAPGRGGDLGPGQEVNGPDREPGGRAEGASASSQLSLYADRKPDQPGNGQDHSREREVPKFLAAPMDHDRPRGVGGRASGPRWSERFRRSADRAAEQGPGGQSPNAGGVVVKSQPQRARADKQDIAAVRSIDPGPYLEAKGYSVQRQGNHMSVLDHQGDEAFRISKKPEGHYVACDRHSQGIGDNIALVQQIDRCKLPQAVYALKGAELNAPPMPKKKGWEPPTAPTMPGKSWDLPKEVGTDYLKRRGISEKTIEHAEKSGFFKFLELEQGRVAMQSRHAVAFVGKDGQGYERNISLRATEDRGMQKQDVAGSRKAFPPILPGNPKDVLIVEGGLDALAARDIALKKGYEPPTTIVSGGAGVRSFLDTPHVQQLLKRAERVSVAYDNEKDQETQKRTDAQHDAQSAKVQQITGRPPAAIRPPTQVKDLAEANQQGMAPGKMQSISDEKHYAEVQSRIPSRQEPGQEQQRQQSSPAPRPPGMDMGRG